MSVRKPTVTKLAPPCKTAETILAYFTDPDLQYDRSSKMTFGGEKR